MTEGSVVSLVVGSRVVNPEANSFVRVHCNFRQGVTFGKARPSLLFEGTFLKRRYSDEWECSGQPDPPT